jgi:CheY-like chemotaxis protein
MSGLIAEKGTSNIGDSELRPRVLTLGVSWSPKSGGKVRRVLVVDDDQGTRETWGVALRHAGYDVHLANSGSAAITILSGAADIHALLLDLKLGDMTGYDVLRWMRAQPVLVPTAVMTAFHAEFDPDEAITLGALAYSDQPLSNDDILALAETLTVAPSPSDDPLRLHTQFLAGRPSALDCLASAFLMILPPRLARAFPRVPRDFTIDAATDACLEYAANPTRFDPSRSASIVDFVYLIARRNLADRLRAEIALKNREVRYARKQPVTFIPELPMRRSDIGVWAAVAAVTINSSERLAVELWLADAGSEAVAQALGMGHWDQEDRRRGVKRFKDRLLKRLSRYFRPLPWRG